jgi:hypothetical protein
MKKKMYLALGILIFSSLLINAQGVIVLENILEKEKMVLSDYGVRYYYYPNLQAYFDNKIKMFILKQNGIWITSKTLNFNSRGYSIRNGFHVMLIDFYDDNPQLLFDEHKLKYPVDFSSKQRRKQIVYLE